MHAIRETAAPTAATRAQQARQQFDLGLAFYRKQQWKTAARHFSDAVREGGPEHNRGNLYLSYQGLCQVCSGDISGLNLCRRAAALETIHSRVLVNLALAEVKLGHRKRACSAVKLGLSIDPRDPNLLRLRERMGVRRTPVLPFLKREHLLNRLLGRYTWQRLQATQ